ncbi:hypothetical protein SLEP1_g27897 [Rubroshorea leprosula]|uniref:Uncharacterized protein n=1 Tax=Rubroshorea leprosula TaxID=152421 RepID=A0AAV5JUJ9_9ROSI|nr:hypothetical protein SLEP1_g27897 [Rubroshorea leprosula]
MALISTHSPWLFVFGLLGNISSFVVFLAPISTFYRIWKKKSTEGFHSVPYLTGLFSAMLWIYYALLKANAFLLITINAFHCVIETIYIALYITYAPRKVRTTAFSSLSNLVTQKLTSDNFLLWKGQIVPISRGYGVMGYLDGSKPTPSEFVELEDDKGKTNMEPNLEYEKWYAQDQQLLWSTLCKSYAQQSEVRLMYLQNELQNTKRDGKSIEDYWNRMKKIFDQLAIIQHPVNDLQKVHHVLTGLVKEYKMFVTVVLAKPPLPSYDDLKTLFPQHELAFNITSNASSGVTDTPLQSSASHNVHYIDAQYDHRNKGRGMRQGRGRGNFNAYNSSHYSPSCGYGGRRQFFNQNYHQYSGSRRNSGDCGILLTPANAQACQICGKFNNLASECYYRHKNQNEPIALTHSIASSSTISEDN